MIPQLKSRASKASQESVQDAGAKKKSKKK
jgi:hypothetical protein